MIHVYTICTSPHLYQGRVCPLDGARRPHADQVLQAVEALRARGIPITLAALREVGIPTAALDDLVLMEFGREELAFEALELGGMVHNGRIKGPLDWG